VALRSKRQDQGEIEQDLDERQGCDPEGSPPGGSPSEPPEDRPEREAAEHRHRKGDDERRAEHLEDRGHLFAVDGAEAAQAPPEPVEQAQPALLERIQRFFGLR